MCDYIIDYDGNTYRRLTDWIQLKDGKFELNNKTYSLEDDFDNLNYPIFYDDDEGKLCFLSAVEKDEWVHPFLLELSECVDWIRVYS